MNTPSIAYRPSRNPNTGAGFGEFFRYHGWLSPGVRLFRSLGFRAKALWISAAFVIPLALMLFYLWSAASSQVEFARAERAGLTFVKPTLDLLLAAERLRTAAVTKAPDMSDHQARVRAAFDKVAPRNTELGKAFNTQEAFGALTKAHQAVQQTPLAASPDGTFKTHTALVDAALELVNAIANGSNLALDPDLDTYHLMNFSVLLGPQQYDNLARMVSMGALVLTTKDRSEEHLDVLKSAASLQAYLEKGMEGLVRLRGSGLSRGQQENST